MKIIAILLIVFSFNVSAAGSDGGQSPEPAYEACLIALYEAEDENKAGSDGGQNKGDSDGGQTQAGSDGGQSDDPFAELNCLTANQ